MFGMRHVQTFMLFLCLTLAYAFRVNMSVGIVAITNNESNPDFEQHDWDKKTQSLVLSSFFWGYVISQVPAGLLGAKYGVKYLLLVTMALNAVFCVLTPIMAHIGGAWAVIACRIIQGLCQGFFFPSMHNMIAQWIPPAERGRLGTFIYAGAQFGTVLAMPISGFLAESSLGWPSIFYVFGASGIVWSVLWLLLGSNSPAEHKTISSEEKKYIESSLGTEVVEERPATPWYAMLTSLPMWALILVHVGHNWGFWTLLTEMPSYMDSVLNFKIKDNGLYSALPYLVMWLLSFVFSGVSDWVINRKLVSVVFARKFANCIGHWIPAVVLIGLSYVTSAQTGLAVTLLTIAVGVNSACYVGFQVNHIDLAPKHAGTMMGITNAIANLSSIFAPILVGFIVPEDSHDVEPWRVVFFISSAVYFLLNLFFVLFGKADVQPWNDVEKEKDVESESPRYTQTELKNI